MHVSPCTFFLQLDRPFGQSIFAKIHLLHKLNVVDCLLSLLVTRFCQCYKTTFLFLLVSFCCTFLLVFFLQLDPLFDQSIIAQSILAQLRLLHKLIDINIFLFPFATRFF